MKRSERLKSLRSVAAHEEGQQSRRFGLAQEDLANARRRLEELTAYRREYQTYSGTPASGQVAAPAVNWQEHHNFLKRLDEAVSTQNEVVSRQHELAESERRLWLQKRQRLESLDRVMERYAGLEKSEEARREQRLQDAAPPPETAFARRRSPSD